MKIKSVRIENFRSFQDQTIPLSAYTCFVGANGAGKSSILAALNVFFREQDASATDCARLSTEDFYQKVTDTPVRVTVTFEDLSPEADVALSAYVRQQELVITAEAAFDENTGVAQVRHYGQRLAMTRFCPFFDAEKAGQSAVELNGIYDNLRTQFPDLPVARSKDAKIEALRAYEEAHADQCVLVASEDNFYGINSTGRLSAFVQWIYVPAVKDAGDEGQESKNTALGKLINRVVRTRSNFESALVELRSETASKYKELLQQNQENLTGLAESLQRRLISWAHPNVQLGLEWLFDQNKSVVLQQPIAGIKTGEGDFLGNIARMGHGLQRSYLLALLQELASSEVENAPTLLLGCEEPELYQHPPQARHLADVFADLAKGNNQILVTSHSPFFVNGDGFENTRLVRRANRTAGTTVRSFKFENLCAKIRTAQGDQQGHAITGMIAKIHQALQPGIAEMFYSRVPILVEGLEDVAYITTALHLTNQWTEFRRLGCHLIPVNGKDKLIQPLAIATELDLPVFVIFDADGNTAKPEHKIKHENDNRALFYLLGVSTSPFPADNIWGVNHAVWNTNLTDVVRQDFGAVHAQVTESTRLKYAQEGGLEKNSMFIADWLDAAHRQGSTSQTLTQLCTSLLSFAKAN